MEKQVLTFNDKNLQNAKISCDNQITIEEFGTLSRKRKPSLNFYTFARDDMTVVMVSGEKSACASTREREYKEGTIIKVRRNHLVS